MTKIITLQESHDLILKALIVMIDGCIADITVSTITGDPSNQWLYCSWEDDDGQKFGTAFIEEDQEITLSSSIIFMKDSEDEDTAIFLLGPMLID